MMNTIRGLAASCLLLTCATQAATAADLGPTLQKIKDTGTITIGNRESSVPLSYLDDSQTPIGFSIDLCGLVVDKLKTDLALPGLKVVYQPVNSSNRIPLVENGTVDIECGSTANTVPRQAQVAFSVTTFAPQFKWISLASQGLKTTEDLKGKTIAVTQGTNTAQFVAKLNADKGLGMNILQGKDHAESFLLVQTGRAAAFMEDDILLAGLKANAKDPSALTFLADAFPSDPYGLMLSKNDPSFKKLVDEALTAAMQSGVYDKLYTKWFESKIPPKNINLEFPMSDKLKALVKAPNDKANGQ
ncbi:transporter substrate-binding domain-containing protein [Rhizobium sp. CNPSo 4039]|uniref:transporter substrate-binding domain-containing protein n=1 Tax=Rhizobium sp. CNPSo 4039 TaxID=3021409 RepID=UPI00254FEDED|nr:transporter substrate-binding domain-containing protein [Rhizobium sp. CNPSo 4039]MDK4717287.1 transporter substrate-binding domain-containing protein [Rhizobium sp. CNPSo 4039]